MSLRNLLYDALATDFGIELSCSEPEAFKQKLYAERRAAKDPDLAVLSFVTPPGKKETHVWIVKNNA